MGFDWKPNKKNLVSRALLALKSYKEQYGDLSIPRPYVVPVDSEFPVETWGLKLGNFLSNVRYRGDYIKKGNNREMFEKLGLSMDHVGTDTRHWDYVYSALQVYKQEYGHVAVPSDWAVPSCQPWPEQIWDLKLGYRCNNIRYRGDFVLDNPCYRILLDELGFVWKLKSRKLDEMEMNTFTSCGDDEVEDEDSIRMKKAFDQLYT